MNKMLWMTMAFAGVVMSGPAWAQVSDDTTAGNAGEDTPVATQPAPANETAQGAVTVIMPDGSTLQVNDYVDNPWYKDSRLQGYTRYVFDPEKNAYKMMKDGDNSDAKPFCDGKKKDWCN